MNLHRDVGELVLMQGTTTNQWSMDGTVEMEGTLKEWEATTRHC